MNEVLIANKMSTGGGGGRCSFERIGMWCRNSEVTVETLKKFKKKK